ncbi:MAG: DNA repair protein RadC [Eubacterium sp.]|nr:DNA repair protein RadC [Eubacterium sp.]
MQPIQQKHFTVKELPDSEKPYEKCRKYGAEYLSDAELLAVLIRTGKQGKTSIELAQQFLKDGNGNLLNLYEYSLERIMQIPGLGPVKAVQLKCIAEISKRIAETTRMQNLSFDNPASIAAYFMEQMRHEPKEQVRVCLLDMKCHFLGSCVLSIGTVNASILSPRDIFREALRANAAFVILLHNHPSGDPRPSREDQKITAHIAECGRMLQIGLADHIIIGDNQYYSFREKGLLDP